jgi:virginiamycin B lyase
MVQWRMIAQRLTVAGALAAFGAMGASCSSAGNPGGLPLPASDPSAASLSRALERVTIAQFADLPEYQGYYTPSAIASGPDKSLWITDTIDQDFGENVVVQIATSGKQLHTFYYGGKTSEGANFVDITAGPDGALWITDTYNAQILRMTTSGTYTGFSLGFLSPPSIVTGPDNALWFTAQSGNGSEIGRITTNFKETQYAASGGVHGITLGPDKALWYTEEMGNATGRITAKGKITQFTKGISSGANPYSIAAGPDGDCGLPSIRGGRIGRITTAGEVTEYSRYHARRIPVRNRCRGRRRDVVYRERELRLRILAGS